VGTVTVCLAVWVHGVVWPVLAVAPGASSPALHSFPTRRSSDLDRQIRTWEEGGQVEPETRQFDAQAGVTRAMRAKSEAEDYRYLDRKSTRLNSSHVKISYAVFCLKKKKTHVQFGARRARRIAAL